MKKILLIFALALIACGSANAVTLFPYFVDIAGNYRDGTLSDIQQSLDDDDNLMYSAKPSFYKSLADADTFLQDSLPFSTENIIAYDVPGVKNGVKVKMYVSPMLDNVLSAIFLIEIPEKGFYVGYDEKQM